MKDITVKPLLNVYSSQMYEKCFIWKNSKMDFNYFYIAMIENTVHMIVFWMLKHAIQTLLL